MSLPYLKRRRGLGLATWMMVLVVRLAYAQALGTLNGRVVDQGDAVLPGVTITATHTGTGVIRTTVTNETGVYSLPGLAPGPYEVKTELSGFGPGTRRGTLIVGATLTLDFTLGVAGLSETLTVSGAAPVIEVTQSRVGAVMQATEVANLPVLTRNYVGLVALLPGAKPVLTGLQYKDNAEIGGVSFGGSGGRNISATLDGGDNADLFGGGIMMNYSQESIEEFRLSTHQFTAVDGRTNGAALALVTKSGGNQFHGSALGLMRNKALIAKDYFAERDNLPKPDYNRWNYGGSIGGPLKQNRIFFFGAAEGVNVKTSIIVPDALYNEQLLLVPYGGKPVHEIAQPFHDAKYTVKLNAELSANHSLLGRYSGQRNQNDNSQLRQRDDQSQPGLNRIQAWSGVVQHRWTLSPSAVSELTFQANSLSVLQDRYLPDGGPLYSSGYPNVPEGPPALEFPSVTMGGSGGARIAGHKLLPGFRGNVSMQRGTHALTFGAGYNRFEEIGFDRWATDAFGLLSFFDDPSVIVSNSNGRYPQGFQTPGIVRQSLRGPLAFVGAKVDSPAQFMSWLQDDWRMTPRLTLNLGVRYDLDINLYDQRRFEQNPTYQILADIGNPYGAFPKTPTRDISPRAGLAYDLRGDGRRVLRGGYGLYFGSFCQCGTGTILQQMHRPLLATVQQTNTAIGVGQLADYRFGIDPQPPRPDASDTLPSNAIGYWFDPDLGDAYTHQVHVGYAHELAPNTTLSVDYTHIAGRNEFRDRAINPLVNGARVLAPEFARVYGDPNRLSAVRLFGSWNRSQFDELIIQFQRRLPRATFQAHYTLSGSYAYGGQILEDSNKSPESQDAFDVFAPGEWGPTSADERHRVVAFGVFELPYGIQLSPVFQTATPRPYTLLAGTDLNRDGTNNDRYVDPATRQQVAVHSERGDPTAVMDLRMTKTLAFGTARRLGLFAEVFNVFNTANFGASYQENSRSAQFKQPIGFLPSIGIPRQVQFGARFQF